MKVAITPSFRDLFKEEVPEIHDLLFDVPSKIIIGLMSMINSELFLNNSGWNSQIKIFQFITRKFSHLQKEYLGKNLLPFYYQNKGQIPIFTLWYTTEFIHHELINYRDFSFDDTTPEQEFRILKAYFLIVQKLNDDQLLKFNSRRKINEEERDFAFQYHTWPILASQFDFNNKIDPAFQALKSFVLLDNLSKRELTKKYVEDFLKVVKKRSLWHYVFDLIKLVEVSLTKSNDKDFRAFRILSNQGFDYILKTLSIKPEEYKRETLKHLDYKGIREKPLFQFQNNLYLVMNWNYLYNQLNLGLLFDFYHRSGIAEKFKSFPDFKSFVSDEIYEKGIFNNLLKKILFKKYTVTFFDNGNDISLPDCYYRSGQCIFLFEFKDALMPAAVINSFSFEKIKRDIDLKFVENLMGKGKGITQLINHIKLLNGNHFNLDDFDAKKIKRKNIIIYPIIVYTHFMYSLPGVREYLNSIFNRKLKEIDKLEFKKVKDLTMIELDFFHQYLFAFTSGRIDLKELIDSYQKISFNRRKKAQQSQDTEKIIDMYPNFEQISARKIGNNKEFFKKGFMTEIFEAFNIQPDLPKE